MHHVDDVSRPGCVDEAAPPRPRWVSRPRLLQLIAGASDGGPSPIVLVSGPAGSGKSVLARQWLETDDRAHLEIPVTPGLDEPGTPSRAAVEALEAAGPSARGRRRGRARHRGSAGSVRCQPSISV